MRGSLFALVLLGAVVAAPAAAHAQHPPSSAPPPIAPQSTRADSACPGCPRKRPVVAVLYVLASNVFINRFDTWVLNVHDPAEGYWARVSPRSWSDNIHSGWVWDTDNFGINMFGHPYQGGAYFRSGRTNGLNFWESVPLAFLGSAQWEFFGETTKPSLNDFYNTGFGGIIVGETVYRLVMLIRDNQARGAGRVLRELAAFPLDPAGGLQRLVEGNFTRVYANPGEHLPPPLALQLQTMQRAAEQRDADEHRGDPQDGSERAAGFGIEGRGVRRSLLGVARPSPGGIEETRSSRLPSGGRRGDRRGRSRRQAEGRADVEHAPRGRRVLFGQRVPARVPFVVGRARGEGCVDLGARARLR